jgi:hypothetical protein
MAIGCPSNHVRIIRTPAKLGMLQYLRGNGFDKSDSALYTKYVAYEINTAAELSWRILQLRAEQIPQQCLLNFANYRRCEWLGREIQIAGLLLNLANKNVGIDAARLLVQTERQEAGLTFPHTAAELTTEYQLFIGCGMPYDTLITQYQAYTVSTESEKHWRAYTFVVAVYGKAWKDTQWAESGLNQGPPAAERIEAQTKANQYATLAGQPVIVYDNSNEPLFYTEN